MCEPFQGYSSRETFDLALWLSNEQGLYEMTREIANGSDDLDEATENLRTWIQDVLWDELMDTEAGRVMVRDVGSLYRVNFKEVTQQFREE